jgi:NitT/TauT family transport system substrate-binding protein
MGWLGIRWIGLLLLFFILFCAVASPASAADAAMKKATFMLLWSPQAQFAGYYVALDKKIYSRHGIDLTILKAGPGHSPEQALKNGAADFAIL